LNKFNAFLTSLKQYQNISELSFDALGFKVRMVTLELQDELEVGKILTLKAKATNIALAKEINKDISISNQLKGLVVEVDNGEILCSVKIKIEDTIIESIITQNSASAMNIKVGDDIVALIKASDLSYE
jgi:molybdopterin-binding protein